MLVLGNDLRKQFTARSEQHIRHIPPLGNQNVEGVIVNLGLGGPKVLEEIEVGATLVI